MTRQAKFNRKLRASGRCGCGRKATQAGKCSRCAKAHREYMRERMRRIRAKGAG